MSLTPTLGDDEVVELAEMLEFLHDWASVENDPLEASLRRFAFGLFTLDELRRDIARFAFLLGGPCLAADTEEDEW